MIYLATDLSTYTATCPLLQSVGWGERSLHEHSGHIAMSQPFSFRDSINQTFFCSILTTGNMDMHL